MPILAVSTMISTVHLDQIRDDLGLDSWGAQNQHSSYIYTKAFRNSRDQSGHGCCDSWYHADLVITYLLSRKLVEDDTIA